MWFDEDSLLPGKKWREEIGREIANSDCFLALLSSCSVSKRGYVQAELKKALATLEEAPFGTIFLIPVRLDECTLREPRLQELQRVDLFADWDAGVEKISKSLKEKSTRREASNYTSRRRDARSVSITRKLHSPAPSSPRETRRRSSTKDRTPNFLKERMFSTVITVLLLAAAAFFARAFIAFLGEDSTPQGGNVFRSASVESLVIERLRNINAQDTVNVRIGFLRELISRKGNWSTGKPTRADIARFLVRSMMQQEDNQYATDFLKTVAPELAGVPPERISLRMACNIVNRTEAADYGTLPAELRQTFNNLQTAVIKRAVGAEALLMELTGDELRYSEKKELWSEIRDEIEQNYVFDWSTSSCVGSVEPFYTSLEKAITSRNQQEMLALKPIYHRELRTLLALVDTRSVAWKALVLYEQVLSYRPGQAGFRSAVSSLLRHIVAIMPTDRYVPGEPYLNESVAYLQATARMLEHLPTGRFAHVITENRKEELRIDVIRHCGILGKSDGICDG